MNFLNPAVLLGLIAAAIPLILHLLNLRKLKTIEFSSLQFLKEMQKNKIRKLKLKQLILLILRTLLVIFIVLAFARPTIDGTLPGFESFAKTSAVILLDNSFSMDLSDENSNRFNQAKKTIRGILQAMKEGDEAVIIEMASNQAIKQYAFSRSSDYLQSALDNIKISYIPADLNKSISYAGQLLTAAMNFSKEVYIITDAQANIFTQSAISKIDAAHTNVYLLPVGYTSTSEIKNYSVDSLNIVSRIFQSGKPVEIEAVIKNNTSSKITELLTNLIFNNERVAQRSVDLHENQIRQLTLAATPPSEFSGAVQAAVEIEHDAFDADNKRYFGFVLPARPNVAIFGTSGNKNFISTAISAASIGDGNNSKFANLSSYQSSDISSVNLAQFDLVILATGKFTSSDFNRLKQYISGGGNSLIFANNYTELATFGAILAEFGFGKAELKEFSTENPSQFTTTDKIHPLFEGVFKIDTDSRGIVESPKIYKALVATAGQSLIEIGSGNFLTENIYGDGKILYCAVPPDLEWSNFPLTGVFPAVIIRSIAYLASRPVLSYNFEIGSGNEQIIIPKKFCTGGNFRIIDPNGNEFLRQAAMLPAGGVLSFNDMNIAGVYTIYNSNNTIVALVSLNLQSSESDFAKLSEKQLIDSLKLRFENPTTINFISNLDEIASSVARTRTGTELWRFCLILALLAALAEMLIQKFFK